MTITRQNTRPHKSVQNSTTNCYTAHKKTRNTDYVTKQTTKITKKHHSQEQDKDLFTFTLGICASFSILINKGLAIQGHMTELFKDTTRTHDRFPQGHKDKQTRFKGHLRKLSRTPTKPLQRQHKQVTHFAHFSKLLHKQLKVTRVTDDSRHKGQGHELTN
jgi:hypothetical protein